MTEQENLLAVKEHLSAYKQGNVDKALSYFAEKIDFQSPVSQNPPKQIKWAQPRKTKEEVKAYFDERQSDLTLDEFNANDFTIKGDKVIVEGNSKGKVKASDKPYDYNWVMIFELNEGKIIRNYHYYDTYSFVEALGA